MIVPTIKREKIYIEKQAADGMLLELAQIKISPVPVTASVGTDGTFYELRLNSVFNNAYFRWWEAGPENWSELTTGAVKILEFFHNAEKRNK